MKHLWPALLAITLSLSQPVFAFNKAVSPGEDVSAAEQVPKQLKEVRVDQNLDEQLPLDLKFTNEAGKEVQLKDYFGKRPVIITPVYFECPMLCTQVLNGLMSSIRVLEFNVGKEYDILTYSFDPRETTELAVEKKKNYIASYRRPGAENGWHFITGNEASIKKLSDAIGFHYVWDDKVKQFAHAAAIVVATPEGKVARYFYGIEYSPRDLRLGLVEASENKIGSKVDQLLLYCYHYDPMTGKYGATTINLIRAAGLLTILALGSFMFIMFRRDLRRKRLGEEQVASHV